MYLDCEVKIPDFKHVIARKANLHLLCLRSQVQFGKTVFRFEKYNDWQVSGCFVRDDVSQHKFPEVFSGG